MEALVTPTAADLRTSEAFDALMWAMTFPGTPRPVEGTLALAESLLDRETTFFADDAALAEQLARTGARSAPIARAEYVFASLAAEADVARVAAASAGSALYPDGAATLFAPATLGGGTRLRLSGPGIKGRTEISVGGIHPSFWDRRARAGRYPMGWDLYLVAGDRVVGIPRSTRVEVI